MQRHLERYCDTLLVLGFNLAYYRVYLAMTLLWPVPVNKRDIEPTVTKKANKLVSFIFGKFQLLDILNFLRRVLNIGFFPNCSQHKRNKKLFPLNSSNNLSKWIKQNFPLMRCFPRNCELRTIWRKKIVALKKWKGTGCRMILPQLRWASRVHHSGAGNWCWKLSSVG